MEMIKKKNKFKLERTTSKITILWKLISFCAYVKKVAIARVHAIKENIFLCVA